MRFSEPLAADDEAQIRDLLADVAAQVDGVGDVRFGNHRDGNFSHGLHAMFADRQATPRTGRIRRTSTWHVPAVEGLRVRVDAD
jgi:hypothetical protein